jgi:hypothetical protein
MSKVSNIIYYLLLALGVVVFVMVFTSENYDSVLWTSYIYAIIATLGTLVSSVAGMIAKPSAFKGTLVGIVGMLVIFGLSYALADGTVLSNYPKGTTESASLWSDVGLIAMYILAGLTVLSVVFSGVWKLVNR